MHKFVDQIVAKPADKTEETKMPCNCTCSATKMNSKDDPVEVKAASNLSNSRARSGG